VFREDGDLHRHGSYSLRFREALAPRKQAHTHTTP
jgi:hypothetical protein